MGTMAKSTTVPDAETTDNVLTGLDSETVQRASRVEFRASAAADGLHATLRCGNRIIVDDVLVSDSDRFPTFEDKIAVFGAAHPAIGPERLILKFRNPTNADIAVKWSVDVKQL